MQSSLENDLNIRDLNGKSQSELISLVFYAL